MMTVDRLHELFEEKAGHSELQFGGRCHDCGKETTVAVAMTAGGFAVSGGALYEPDPGRFLTKCDACFRQRPQLSEFRRCEVYSRVVGYLRPVSQWNEGKQAEFGGRKVYSV